MAQMFLFINSTDIFSFLFLIFTIAYGWNFFLNIIIYFVAFSYFFLRYLNGSAIDSLFILLLVLADPSSVFTSCLVCYSLQALLFCCFFSPVRRFSVCLPNSIFSIILQFFWMPFFSLHCQSLCKSCFIIFSLFRHYSFGMFENSIDMFIFLLLLLGLVAW